MKSEASRILLHPISILFYIAGVIMLSLGMSDYEHNPEAWTISGVSIIGVPFIILFFYVIFSSSGSREGKILTLINIFLSLVLLYPVYYNSVILSKATNSSDVYNSTSFVSLALTATFSGLLTLIIPFYKGTYRKFFIVLFSIWLLIFSMWISLMFSTVNSLVDYDNTRASPVIASNTTAAVVASILLALSITSKI